MMMLDSEVRNRLMRLSPDLQAARPTFCSSWPNARHQCGASLVRRANVRVDQAVSLEPVRFAFINAEKLSFGLG